MAEDRTSKEYRKTHYQKYGKAWYEANKDKHSAAYKRSYANNIPRHLWRGAKLRAVSMGVTFDLEVSDVIVPDVCPILKTKFVVGTMYAASIDRIDNTKGYVRGNVQVISRKANTMKGDCSPAELVLFAEWIGRFVGLQIAEAA